MKNNKNIALLLTPSWVVNFIGGSIALLLTGAVIILSRFQSSELRQQLFEAKSQTTNQSGAVSSTFTSVGDYITDNKILSAAPLLITWACVGLLVYFFATSIARAFGTAINMHDELNYVHTSRGQLLREATLHLGIRVVATLGWFMFIKLSLNVFVPYALACGNIAAQSLSVASVGYALLGVVVLYFDVYIHAIFLRLVFLRPRLFGV